jgi:hypothetical protein
VTRHGTYPTAAANAVEIRVKKIAQLFHSLDPFPFREKDLDNDVEEFIVGWARELPPDKPLRIVIHLPETEASTSEAHELGAAFAQYFDYRARVIALDLNELFRVGRRAMAIGLTVLSFSVITGQTAVNLAPDPIGVSSKRACLFSDGPRIGGQSKYFCTTGGRSFDGAICINDFRRRM